MTVLHLLIFRQLLRLGTVVCGYLGRSFPGNVLWLMNMLNECSVAQSSRQLWYSPLPTTYVSTYRRIRIRIFLSANSNGLMSSVSLDSAQLLTAVLYLTPVVLAYTMLLCSELLLQLFTHHFSSDIYFSIVLYVCLTAERNKTVYSSYQ